MSRLVSSSTKALDLDQVRYITSGITQYVRSMATDTRFLPTDLPVPYFQPFERGHLSEGVPEGTLCRSMQIPPHGANSDVFPYLPSDGMEYNPGVFEQDRLSTYTGLDNYDTLRLDMVGEL